MKTTAKHILTVTKNEKKSGALYIYRVFDPNGNVVATRQSNRKYIAALVTGHSFFGRVDLAQSFMGTAIKQSNDWIAYAKKENKPDAQEMINRSLEHITWAQDPNSIAYLEDLDFWNSEKQPGFKF